MKSSRMRILFALLTAVALLMQVAVAESITFTGTVAASETHEVYAPIGGKVEKVNGEALEIRLDDYDTFTAALGDGALELTPSGAASAWVLNGYALKTLVLSGIDTLRLTLNGETVDFATSAELRGDAYGALCAAGYVSRDYEYTVYPGAVTVSVAGETYSLSDDGLLARTEGR